ncbi:MAG TPA: sulfite exporter TauE/SafE family protein [Polyangiales bacterium]|nr:sulfite exporter TauE/SafE family protein [Polyangiales bacterium]
MLDARSILLFALAVVALAFAAMWFVQLRKQRRVDKGDKITPGPIELVIGFISDFLDTLGISSFATTTAMFRTAKTLDDRQLPGTLNVGHALPTVLQAYIYIEMVQVDVLTLASMIAASMLGAALGANAVVRLSERSVRLGMGIALLLASTLLLARLLNWLPGGSDALELRGPLLAVAIGGNFVLGALMTLGIGLYAPCMILVSLLGMNPTAAFPIMMGSCAFLMPVASRSFLKQGAYHPRAALGLAIGGMPAVLIAAYIVKQLDLTTMRWLVLGVVLYTGVSLLLAARRPSAQTGEPQLTPPAASG